MAKVRSGGCIDVDFWIDHGRLDLQRGVCNLANRVMLGECTMV